ncbi:MAG: ribosomal RNA small subunit methyltransferase A [Alphaproteobacteria bacterium]|nr:MAG: ribosomal RNA small subunit methyltransferase A [Alphaproteobacteria bacterium]
MVTSMFPSNAVPGLNVSALPTLEKTLVLTNFRAKKSLGQNFLLDMNITRRIARAAPHIDQGTVLEIGPGPGGLTRALFVEGARHVIAIDPDMRAAGALGLLSPHLEEGRKLEFLNEDVLKLSLHTLGVNPRQVVANIPYNLTSPIVIQLLRHIDAFSCITIMVQKEVAARLMADTRTKDYGRLSIITQWCCEGRALFTLPPEAFTPAPKVSSTVIQLTPRKNRETVSFQALEKLTHLLFQQRRKMLRGTLRHLSEEDWNVCIDHNIQPTQRPEELNVQKMCWLANFLDK